MTRPAGPDRQGKRTTQPDGLGTLAIRWFVLVALSVISLQLFFAARIALMAGFNPESTAFQRSEFWRVVVVGTGGQRPLWRHDWRSSAQISTHLKRAVIASEDAAFNGHSGFEWDSLEKAWDRNRRAQDRAERLNQIAADRAARSDRNPSRAGAQAAAPRTVEPRLVGGSTISQQLAKNLFLSGERTAARKGQEFVLTFMLEGLLGKARILEIYLNSVEWGEGVFGAQAAAQRYWQVDAAHLSAGQAARLAVMLPAPKRFEKNPGSAYVTGRAATIAARMSSVELP